jgi:hypothetical protein
MLYHKHVLYVLDIVARCDAGFTTMQHAQLCPARIHRVPKNMFLAFWFEPIRFTFESLCAMSRVAPLVVDASKALVQTRVPHAMRVYLRAYGKHHNLKMEALLTEVLTHFLTLRPDSHGLTWRRPQSHRTESGAEGGWAQINVLIPDEVAGKLAGLSMQLGLSRAVISYSALYWFARFMRPPLNPSLSPPDVQNNGVLLTTGAARG